MVIRNASWLGMPALTEENRAGSAPIVILGHCLWESRFGGDPAVVGRTVALDNKCYLVVGILPAGFGLLRRADLWMPLGQFDDDLRARSSRGRDHRPAQARHPSFASAGRHRTAQSTRSSGVPRIP
jgi:MacB-like periplasmic core domain